MKARTWWAAAAASSLLWGCGGGGGGGATGEPAAPQAAAFEVAPGIDMSIDFSASLPVHYEGVAALDNTPPGAISSNAVASLGRVLFYDKRMSINDSVSCASCHNHKVDFADSKRFSDGFAHGTSTTAHAMRLANLKFFKGGTMFWDKRAPSLEKQASQPLQHPIEMGFDEAHGGMPALVLKMQGLPMYPQLFTQAFGDPDISEDRIQQALSQFMRAIVSTNSRWDTAYAQVFDPALPDKGLGLPLPGFTDRRTGGDTSSWRRGPRAARPARPATHRPASPWADRGATGWMPGRPAPSSRRLSRTSPGPRPSCTTGASPRWSRWSSTTTAV